MSIKIERAAEREFSVFEVETNKFMNLDFIFSLGFDNDGNEPEPYFNNLPEKGFTYEECERFIIHQKGNKKLYSIHNIRQPFFLLNFHLKVLRSEFNEEQKKERAKRDAIRKKLEDEQEAKQRLKQRFLGDLSSWKKELNDPQTQFTGNFGKVRESKPKLKDYGLEFSDFTERERISLNRDYNIN